MRVAFVALLVCLPVHASRPYLEDVAGGSGASVGGGASWQFVIGFLIAMALCAAAGRWIGEKGHGITAFVVAASPFWAPIAFWCADMFLH